MLVRSVHNRAGIPEDACETKVGDSRISRRVNENIRLRSFWLEKVMQGWPRHAPL